MKKLLFFVGLLLLGIKLPAQIDLGKEIPMDQKIVVGKLANGITYYIRHNNEPKERASFYIIRNVGALLETDKQNGLAHFLEHMAFQGTKNFPGKGIITTLERHGVAFGTNINAYTTHNETVYNISSVPTKDESLLDTCLLVLHDWSYYLTLSPEEIDAERAVITEEWRTRRSADFRMQLQMYATLLRGSKYAVRDIIGSLDVIQNFKPKEIEKFYREWYRTDLEAIAIVGDIDVKQMEEKVKKMFSTIPAVKKPKERPFFAVPEHDEMYYGLITDKEARQSTINCLTILRAPDKNYKSKHAYLRDNLMASLYNTMMQLRFAEMMQKPNVPFLSASIGFSKLLRGYNGFSITTIAKPNQEPAAWEAVLKEYERVKRYGFTENELNRVKINILATLDASLQQKDKVPSDNFAKAMTAHFLENEPLVDFEYNCELYKQWLAELTVEDIAEKAKEWYVNKNQVVVVSGPSENAIHMSEQEAFDIYEKVSKMEIEPYDDKIVEGALIQEEIVGGKIVKVNELPAFGAEEWILSNGAKVIFRKANYEKEVISLTGISPGGASLFDVDMLPAAENASAFVKAYGLADFDAITLSKMLTGKVASCDVTIGDLYENISGSATIRDIETMFQLLYLRFERPRFDQEMHDNMIERYKTILPMIIGTPQQIMKDSLELITSNYHPRTLLFSEEYLNQVTLEKVKQVYKDRIKDASDFTFILVGDIEKEQLKPLVEKYIGALKSEYRQEKWCDCQVRKPQGFTKKFVEIALEVPKTTVIIDYSKKIEFTMENNLRLNVLRGILNLRFTENIREKEGGTYGVGVDGSADFEPENLYNLSVTFDCDPDRMEHLKSLIYKEMENVAETIPTLEEFQKVVANLRKNREQRKNHNDYWRSVIHSYCLTGVDQNDPKNYEQILDRMTPEDVRDFARILLRDTNIMDLVFGTR